MSEVYGSIYQVVCLVNNKVYVGQTVGSLKRRWCTHESSARRGISNSILYSAIRKHGPDNFTIELLTTASSKEELDKLECTYIDGLNAMAPCGYNSKTGGAAGKHSAETKAKLSTAGKGKVLSAETRAKMSTSHIGKPIIDSNGIIYPSISDAARTLGCPRAHISAVLKARGRKTAKGLTFSYYTQFQPQG